MSDARNRLLRVSSSPVGHPVTAGTNCSILDPYGSLGRELYDFLQQKNGGYAFLSAFHYLHIGEALDSTNRLPDLVDWNEPALWRGCYECSTDDMLFFAEDIFGSQYAIRKNVGVVFFDPETAEVESVANDLGAFFDILLRDHDYRTGWSLAKEWQTQFGPIPAGMRLNPTIPFVMGGEFRIENLHMVDAANGMRCRASIFRQLRDLPDGASVKFGVRD